MAAATATPVSRYGLRIKNAKQIVCISNDGSLYKSGESMKNADVCIIENGGLISDDDGRIIAVDQESTIESNYGSLSTDYSNGVIDASGMVLLPGFCDGHSHPIWSGDRVHEFAMKLKGATYMDIHKMGGGIGFTVQKTAASSDDELLSLLSDRLDRFIRHGTTLLEAKSGYGLELNAEIRLLRLLNIADHRHSIDIVSNYCGAHSVPKGSTSSAATDDILHKQIPALIASNARKETNASLIDVFCEKGVFSAEETKKILIAGIEAGLKINFHGDELSYSGSAELAAELNALAISHVEHISETGIAAIAKSKTAAVLLPTTAQILRIAPPPAKKLIDGGCIVALGSDFNPNAHCLSMSYVCYLACIMMHLSMEQSLIAATLNSAYSMDRSKDYGSIEVGKWSDFILLNAPSWQHIIYQLCDPPIHSVIKKGKVVFKNSISSK